MPKRKELDLSLTWYSEDAYLECYFSTPYPGPGFCTIKNKDGTEAVCLDGQQRLLFVRLDEIQNESPELKQIAEQTKLNREPSEHQMDYLKAYAGNKIKVLIDSKEKEISIKKSQNIDLRDRLIKSIKVKVVS